MLAVGDVSRRAIEQCLAVKVNTDRADFDVNYLSVTAQVARFENRALVDEFRHALLEFCSGKLHIPLADMHAQDFIPAITQHLAKYIVCLHDVAFNIQYMNAVVGGMKQYFVAAVGVFKAVNILFRISVGVA